MRSGHTVRGFDARRLTARTPSEHVAFAPVHPALRDCRFLQELGHEVIVANPRKLRAIYASDRRSDKNDARIIARIARVDPELLYPIHEFLKFFCQPFPCQMVIQWKQRISRKAAKAPRKRRMN